MKTLKNLAILGLIAPFITSYEIFASEISDDSFSEESSDNYLWPPIYDIQKVNDSYQKMAENLDVPVEAIRGIHFEPRWFWEKSVDEIFEVLEIPIKQNGVICEIESYRDGFAPKISPHPTEMEMKFEEATYKIIKELSKAENKSMISFEDFVKSLNIGRENGDKFVFSKKRFPATPLITYFEPYF